MKNLILALCLLILPGLAFADASRLQIQAQDVQPGEKIADTYLRYDFGHVYVNNLRSVIFTITAGEVDSHVREVMYSGASYYVGTNCPLILPARMSCDVRIDFVPHFPGWQTGRVIVDLYTQRFIIDLWGTGI